MTNILVVDDEVEFTDMLCVRLEKGGGYGTYKAYDGIEGLRIAEEKLPDLIILDILMPKMNGNELFEKLKSNPKTSKIPIIFLTASVNSPIAKELLAEGTNKFMLKPFESKDLMETIKQLLGK